MPITQDRMLELISAAQDYKQAFERLIDAIAVYSHDAESGKKTHETALQLIAVTANASIMLRDVVTSSQTIIAETLHFKMNKKRNARKADRAREQREYQRLGLPRSDKPTTAPRTLIPPESLASSTYNHVSRIDSQSESPPDRQMISKSTDANQVNANSELEFDELGQAAKSPESRARVDQYLTNLEYKEKNKT